MNRFRNLLGIALIGLALSAPIPAQTLPPAYAYDVASIKPHDPDDRNMSWRNDEGGLRVINGSLKGLLTSAWNLRSDQISGEPSWVDDLRWDVIGKSTELAMDQSKSLTFEQRNLMIQPLLAERFHLKSHLENRTGSVFTMVPAKGGVKLIPIPMTAEEKATGKVSGTQMSMRGNKATVMEATKVPLSLLIRTLAANLRRAVIDKTGLPAESVYDFTLRWTPDDGMAPVTDTDAPTLPTALEEQLGLHLEPGKSPVQLLVIDHIEMPTAN